MIPILNPDLVFYFRMLVNDILTIIVTSFIVQFIETSKINSISYLPHPSSISLTDISSPEFRRFTNRPQNKSFVFHPNTIYLPSGSYPLPKSKNSNRMTWKDVAHKKYDNFQTDIKNLKQSKFFNQKQNLIKSHKQEFPKYSATGLRINEFENSIKHYDDKGNQYYYYYYDDEYGNHEDKPEINDNSVSESEYPKSSYISYDKPNFSFQPGQVLPVAPNDLDAAGQSISSYTSIDAPVIPEILPPSESPIPDVLDLDDIVPDFDLSDIDNSLEVDPVSIPQVIQSITNDQSSSYNVPPTPTEAAGYGVPPAPPPIPDPPVMPYGDIMSPDIMSNFMVQKLKKLVSIPPGTDFSLNFKTVIPYGSIPDKTDWSMKFFLFYLS